MEDLYQGIKEKAREIYGRIKRYLGIDEEGRSPVRPSRRRPQIDVAATEGKRDIEDTESFLEGNLKETKETDQFIDAFHTVCDKAVVIAEEGGNALPELRNDEEEEREDHHTEE